MSKWCLEEFVEVSWQDERCVVTIGKSCFVVERRNGDGNPVWRWLGGVYCGHHNVVKALVDFHGARGDRGEFSEVDRLHFESFSEKLCWLVSDFEKLMQSELAKQAQMLADRYTEAMRKLHFPSRSYDREEPNRFVYLFRHNNGLTKIGMSSDPFRREKTLQAEDPRLHMLAYRPGGLEVEGRLHKIMADKRIRGEWFDLSEKDIDWIVWTLGFYKPNRVA